MTQTAILLCTLAALAGLPIGYIAGALLDLADAVFDAYMDGLPISLYWPVQEAR